MKNLIYIICFVFSFSTLANVEIKILKGDITLDGKKITKSSVIKSGGLLKTGPKSFIKLFSKRYNSNIFLGPKSELKIKFSKKKLPFTLIDGVSRWITQGDSKVKGGIKTKTAIMGVRGTDFITIANKVLGESEIICFDGKAIMKNRKNKNDNATVGKNQWGGLGGRFGTGIGKILDLPPMFVESAKKLLPTK